MKKFIVAAAVAVAASVSLAASVAPARVHPGNFDVNVTPQFVCLGSDDNYFPAGFNWLINYIRSKVNQTESTVQTATYDGAPARMSFYVNTNNAYDITDNTSDTAALLVTAFKQASTDGNELGNHTRTHGTGSNTTVAGWVTEITGAASDLKAVGINDTLFGFRTPYLAYGDNTFHVIDSLNYLYDCSIQSGLDSTTDGTNFVWPYTLDNGPAPSDIASEATYDSTYTVSGHDTTVTIKVHVGNYPGLWEAPSYCVIVPPTLRHQIWQQLFDSIPAYSPTKYDTATVNKLFDTLTGKITGLDYNMWSSNYGGMRMDSAQFLATMKYSLEQRLAGNRAPFCFGMHSCIFYDTLGYDGEGDTNWNGQSAHVPPNATVLQMRGAMERFIDYALSKPEVRFVTQKNLVRWCEAPVPLSAPVGIVHNTMIAGKNLCVRFASGKLMISGLPAGMKTSVSLYNVSGRQIAKTATAGATLSWKLNSLAAGSYLLKLSAPGFTHTTSIVME